MSIESAKAFIERMKSDEVFAKEVTRYKEKDERYDFVVSQGFEFTEEELKAQRSELTEDEMNAISGGWCIYRCDNFWF